MSTIQKTDLLKRRQRLEAHITAFEQHVAVLLNLSEDTRWSTEVGRLRHAEDSAGKLSDDDPGQYSEMLMTPKVDMLSFPSSLDMGEIARNSLEAIAMVEAEL
jgi:hypothetical protein